MVVFLGSPDWMALLPFVLNPRWQLAEKLLMATLQGTVLADLQYVIKRNKWESSFRGTDENIVHQRLRSASSHRLRSMLPAQHVHSSGFFCCWSDGLELTARCHAGSGVFCGQLQTVTEDTSICVRPAVIKFPFHATGSVRTAVGLFLLLVRRSGTHCPMSCGIRSVLWTVTDSHWRHFYLRSTGVFSALEV